MSEYLPGNIQDELWHLHDVGDQAGFDKLLFQAVVAVLEICLCGCFIGDLKPDHLRIAADGRCGMLRVS